MQKKKKKKNESVVGCILLLLLGDVVGCYLAMENGWVDISYTVNGRFCGSAFKIRWMTDEVTTLYFVNNFRHNFFCIEETVVLLMLFLRVAVKEFN